MNNNILHAGFDGLKINVDTYIPEALRARLAAAKNHGKKTKGDCLLEFGSVLLSVTSKGGRGFTAHTGDCGAIWLFQDPLDPIPHRAGVTVDFRAFGLATGGLEGAETHFRESMAAFGIPYLDTMTHISRADFAVDFLAPDFVLETVALIASPRTKIIEHAEADETITVSSGRRVSGLRAGAIANCQLAVYDKRSEVLQSNKLGWLAIWNATRQANGDSQLNLIDRDASQVWRFEMRLGSKQLRKRFELNGWADIHQGIGDAFADAVSRMRYTRRSQDSNRARWPMHELWVQFQKTINQGLDANRCGIIASDVISANREAKTHELDALLCGVFITRAALENIEPEGFEAFMKGHTKRLQSLCDKHPVELPVRIGNARARYSLWD